MVARSVYFEDLETGAQFWADGHLVDAHEMLEYNRRNDPWPFHVDDGAAQASPFGQLIASGGYIVTLMYRMAHTIYNTERARWVFLGGYGGSIRFQQPVNGGDRLRLRITVQDKREANKPGRGLATIRHEIFNQDEAVVYVCDALVALATRPVTPALRSVQ